MPMHPDILLYEIQKDLKESHNIDLTDNALMDMPWAESGLESLALMEMVLHLEQLYECTVSNDALRCVVTFGDLACLMATIIDQESA